MEGVMYTKVDDLEKADGAYAGPPPKYEDTDPLPTEKSKPARTHLLGSILSMLLCCFPAGLIGLVFSIKTCCANKIGDSERAHRFSKYAKWFVVVAVVFGIVALTVNVTVQLGCLAHCMHRARHSFRVGLVSGIADGQVEGAQFAMDRLNAGDNSPLTLPEQLPVKVNIFDIRSGNPFWAEVKLAFAENRSHEAAIPFGYQFGWAHGFKVGFCGVEGSDCTGVELSLSGCPFKAILGDWGKHRRHHDAGHHRQHWRHHHKQHWDHHRRLHDQHHRMGAGMPAPHLV